MFNNFRKAYNKSIAAKLYKSRAALLPKLEAVRNSESCAHYVITTDIGDVDVYIESDDDVGFWSLEDRHFLHQVGGACADVRSKSIYLLRPAIPEEALDAVLAHELGHIVFKHKMRPKAVFSNEFEADAFAHTLGYGEALAIALPILVNDMEIKNTFARWITKVFTWVRVRKLRSYQ